MRKKKPTPPLPLTGVITITTDGRSTLAMKATHRGEDIEVSTGMANCRPGDVYSEYEGARIALARLYGLDPFPKVENGSGEKGRWVKATRENCQKGARVRVVAAENADGAYENGDQGIIQDAPLSVGALRHIIFDGRKGVTIPGCFLRELEVWVPDAPEGAKPQEAPIPEAPKPFTPSFQVGDIVRLWENDNTFATVCRGKVGKVRRVSKISDCEAAGYELAVKLDSGILAPQFCTEWPNDPAPLELLFRDPQKDGEKA